ncbi:MAG: protease HtpX [Gammaproteobacteria bacterium]|nr:protease HtpX [Gammaproteobacteria bacterium]
MRILLFIATNIAVLALASITLSILGVGSMLDETGTGLNLTSLLIICAVFGFAGSLISLFISKWMAKRATGTRVIEQPRTATERWLVDTVKELADKAGVGMPEVGIFDAAQPNAFATGWNRNSSLVAVSTGLMQNMRPEEVRAVLAHEIGHVANGDMITLALVQGVVNTFVMFFARIIGFFVDRVVFKNDRGLGPGYWIVTIVAQIILGILAMMIVMWFSRFREFRADAAGARLAGREHMIAALERLRVGSEMPDAMPESMQAFGINQGLRQGMQALYSSHPPLEARIAALKNAG